MSSSRLSPSVFDEILPSIVATAVALDAFTPTPPPNFIFGNDDDLAATILLAKGADNGDEDGDNRTDNRRGMDKRGKKRAFDFDLGLFNVNRHFLGPSPLFNDHQFERYFRITRRHFELIYQELGKVSKKFEPEACEGFINPQVRLISSLQFLAYGFTFNRDTWSCEMSENSVRVGCENFCASLLSTPLKDKYLRPMGKADARRVEELHRRKFGTPGCMGILDCMHWIWDMCPVGWQGQFKGKEKNQALSWKPCVITIYGFGTLNLDILTH